MNSDALELETRLLHWVVNQWEEKLIVNYSLLCEQALIIMATKKKDIEINANGFQILCDEITSQCVKSFTLVKLATKLHMDGMPDLPQTLFGTKLLKHLTVQQPKPVSWLFYVLMLLGKC